MEFKIIPFEVKAAGDGSAGEGIGNAFHTLDSYNEIVAPGAFIDTIPQFLDIGFIGGLNHNWNEPIGKPVEAGEVKAGLRVAWQLSDTSHGRDVMTLLKDKVVKKLSIGFRTMGYEDLPDEESVYAYWQKHAYSPDAEDKARAARGARLLTKVHLYEVSPVTVPANRMSDITKVKAYDPNDFSRISDYEDLLRDAAGLSREESKTFISRFRSLLRDAGDRQEPTAPMSLPSVASLRAEHLRRKARIPLGA